MAAMRVNRYVPTIKAEHEIWQAVSTVFQVSGMTRPAFEPSLPAWVARAQPIISFRWLRISSLGHDAVLLESQPSIIYFTVSEALS